MLDFRIMVGAIVVCVSIVVIGARFFSTDDALDVAIGERPDLRTHVAPREPTAQRHAEGPLIPPVTLPRTAASTRPPGAEITGSIDPVGGAEADRAATGSAEADPASPAPRRRAAQRRDSDPMSSLLMFFYKHSISK